MEVLDTWSGGYSNTVDRIEDVFEFTSSVVDGRIFCRYNWRSERSHSQVIKIEICDIAYIRVCHFWLRC